MLQSMKRTRGQVSTTAWLQRTRSRTAWKRPSEMTWKARCAGSYNWVRYSSTIRWQLKFALSIPQRLLDAPHPLFRHALVPVVIQRHDLVFQRRVDSGRVRVVAIRGIRLAVADGPAAGGIVGFVEPAVQNAHVQRAVDAGLHAAGAGGFFSAARRVEPDVHAADQLAGHLNAVILHEDHVPGQFRIARELHDFADQRLARDVLRDGLSRRSPAAPAAWDAHRMRLSRARSRKISVARL